MLDTLALVLYFVQQLGVTLGVGAETAVLAAERLAMRDGVVDEKENQFSRAVRSVLGWGLWLMVLSGFAVVALHAFEGQWDVLLEPTFVFKWVLILVAAFIAAALRRRPVAPWVVVGVEGGTWYALFVVHTLAPVASWVELLALYGMWMVGFMLVWGGIVFATRGEKKPAPQKIIAPPPPPKPVAVVRPTPIPPLPLAPRVIQPLVAQSRPQPQSGLKFSPIDGVGGLPAVRVMPQTPEDIQKQNRGVSVQLD